MKMGGVKSKAISSDKLHIENKTIFVDLKENEGGRFLQIAELSNNRRSTVVIPWSGLPVFLEAIQKIKDSPPPFPLPSRGRDRGRG